VSNTWLREEGSYAQIPSVRGTHYYAAVKNHTAPDVDVVSTAVSIIVSTISFQHAREMERQSERGMLPSTDDTIPMGLPAKRAIPSVLAPMTRMPRVQANPKGLLQQHTHVRPSLCSVALVHHVQGHQQAT
ncbi:unnamed protein product, partial [Dicrocoelium dendriticum]